MTKFIALLATASALVAATAFAASPAQEKAFVDAYRGAFEKKDAKALHALLYSKGADPMALDFYKMLLTADFGATIMSITLADLNAEDLKRLEDAKSPDGRPMKMTLKPIKKLILKTTTKSANGSSSGSSESFIAEHEGKLVIPVPSTGR